MVRRSRRRKPASPVAVSAAAIAIGVTGTDERISDWAADETPLFGSRENAVEMSGRLKGALHLLMVGTALVPNDSADSWPRRVVTAAENELAAMVRQGSHSPQGSSVGPFTQLRDRARIFAIEVFPVPREPTNR